MKYSCLIGRQILCLFLINTISERLGFQKMVMILGIGWCRAPSLTYWHITRRQLWRGPLIRRLGGTRTRRRSRGTSACARRTHCRRTSCWRLSRVWWFRTLRSRASCRGRSPASIRKWAMILPSSEANDQSTLLAGILCSNVPLVGVVPS